VRPLGEENGGPDSGEEEHPGDPPPSYTADQAAALETTLQRAHRLGDEGDWQAMATHLRESLEDFPGDPFVLCWLGVAERELGMETVAYERFRQCLQAQPEDPHVLATAGNAVAAFADPDAEAALRTAAMIAPQLPLARWLYGAYLSREGMLEEGLEELRAARELEPDNPEIVYELGVAHALAGNTARAVDLLYRVVELDREDGWTRVLLGLLLLEEDRADDAVAELTAGARLRPEDVEAQLLASLAAGARGMDDLAWEMLERSRQLAAGVDLALAQEVEDRLAQGPEAAEHFLRTQMAPAATRERRAERP
jgi:tetratricopeptide (TPR) repeat protein